MINRRNFVKGTSAIFGGTLISKYANAMESMNESCFYMPDESAPHKRTWMAFVANDYVWSRRQIPQVKKDLISIATTIAKYEPVAILVAPQDYNQAQKMLARRATAYPIDLVEFATDDLWLRDTGPTFVVDSDNKKMAVDFNFNGWGEKQEHTQDAKVAKFIGRQSGTTMQSTQLVLEGGCFEVDGHGNAILTKSCVLNDNRNPGWSQKDVEEELKYLLGLHKIIWLEGIKGKDITDGHTDFYARFVKPGEVIVSRDNYEDSYDYDVTRENIEVLSNSTDADGTPLKLQIIDTPEQINEHYGVKDFAAGYIGYYVCNGAVIAQKFGDKAADKRAKDILEQSFPDRVIEQIAIDGIASGGGSIHCATQQEPLV